LLAGDPNAEVKEEKWRELLGPPSGTSALTGQGSVEGLPPTAEILRPTPIRPPTSEASAPTGQNGSVGGLPPAAEIMRRSYEESDLSELSSAEGEKSRDGGQVEEEKMKPASGPVQAISQPAGETSVAAKVVPLAPHPKTGGKSLELLGIKPPSARKVTLTMKRRAEEESSWDDDESMNVDVSSEDEGPQGRRRKGEFCQPPASSRVTRR